MQAIMKERATAVIHLNALQVRLAKHRKKKLLREAMYEQFAAGEISEMEESSEDSESDFDSDEEAEELRRIQTVKAAAERGELPDEPVLDQPKMGEFTGNSAVACD